MKAKQTITAFIAVAAFAAAWASKQWRSACARKVQFEEKSMQEALDTFEGEGGLVPG